MRVRIEARVIEVTYEGAHTLSAAHEVRGVAGILSGRTTEGIMAEGSSNCLYWHF